MNIRVQNIKPLLFFIFFFICIIPGKAQLNQINIRVISSEAAIYSDTDKHTVLHIRAHKGDIFGAEEVRQDWTSIHMFSDEIRYIESSKIEYIQEIPPYPHDLPTRSRICLNVKNAENKASNEAVRKFPYEIENQGSYKRFLFDVYVLKIFRKFDVPATHYSKLMECNDDSLFGNDVIEYFP